MTLNPLPCRRHARHHVVAIPVAIPVTISPPSPLPRRRTRKAAGGLVEPSCNRHITGERGRQRGSRSPGHSRLDGASDQWRQAHVAHLSLSDGFFAYRRAYHVRCHRPSHATPTAAIHSAAAAVLTSTSRRDRLFGAAKTADFGHLTPAVIPTARHHPDDHPSPAVQVRSDAAEAGHEDGRA